MSRHKGFTLIELMVVLLILALTLSLAWPQLNRPYQRYALNSSATQLAWTLREARSEAMFKGRISSVRFYVSLNRYRSDKQSYYLVKGIQYGGIPTFPSRIGSIPVCSFNATGAPAGGGTVVLKNQLNDKKYIIVNPIVGKVRVSDKPPENW
ncbi:MAG: prepilin-type N-terminal cleavage/methylation domain-containing protein [Syntrophomonadaceae bacterium]|jgi:prepilin-type N-terminal cleavage/methylation domain-containing protein|nr:prepilin-type N-terminal cleavage/methylation domain-containing protein [Syntrophomonadaceae bacterium]